MDKNATYIVIDPGHGGVDGGAVGNGIVEKDLNLLISKYMYDRFRELGIPVKMTRETDETLDQNQRVNKIIGSYGKDNNVIVISNHVNAGGGDGAEVIYALRNNDILSKNILNEFEIEGQNVRKYYQQRLPSNPVKDYYFIHRDTPNTEAVIVEYGFLDSPKDDVNQLKNNYKNYAEAVVRAVCKYRRLPYIAPLGSGYYTVKKGDSLYSIASKFGLTVDNLKLINNLKSNTIAVGQTLKVTKAEEIVPEDFLIYKVKSGDSMYKIASTYKTTVETIMKINNLTSTNLTINQQLLLPMNPDIDVEIKPKPEGYIYKVIEGDSLYKIANRFDVSVEQLKIINNLKSNNLYIGQELIIPGKETNIEEIKPSSPLGISYVVQKGDNLYSIANKYKVSVDDIKKTNNLLNNNLKIGQILIIPGTTDYATYIVAKGDSLWSIANKYKVNVNNLKVINNLTSNSLSIGQKLLIPSK